jgi:hypothetical protein
MKVKIVQVAIASGDDYSDLYYLDDKGRVWFDNGHSEKDGTDDEGKDYYKWVSNWEQIDLPEDPDEASNLPF